MRRPEYAEDEELPPRFRARDHDDDDYDYDEDHEEARQRGKAAGVWFILAPIATIVLATYNIATYLVASQDMNAGRIDDATRMGQVIGLVGCGGVVVLGAIFMFLASAGLNSFKSKGIIITAIVFAFLFAVVFGLGVLVNVVVVVTGPGRGVPDAVLAMAYGTIVLGSATVFVNLFAAIKAIVTLNNPAVAWAFRHRS